jgi:hypothetical protein
MRHMSNLERPWLPCSLLLAYQVKVPLPGAREKQEHLLAHLFGVFSTVMVKPAKFTSKANFSLHI